MSAPIALVALETAIRDWIVAGTGLATSDVYFVEKEDSGFAEPPPPCAQISILSGPIELGQPEIRRIPQIMIQAVDVVTVGAGVLGVSFYLGFDATPTAITITALLGETLPQLRTALLAALALALPAGVTAAADPDIATRILVTGSSEQPLFAMTATNSRTLVTPLLERFVELEITPSRMTWRIIFRGANTNGFGTAADLLGKTTRVRQRIADDLIHAAGWRYAGTLASLPSVPTNRPESRAALDFALVGNATVAFQEPALRRAGIDITT